MPRPLSKRLLPWCLAIVGVGVAIVVWIVLQRIESEESRSEVVVAVKADGSFYLASDPATPLTVERLEKLHDTANPPHCVIAIEGKCPIGAIARFLNSAAEAGFGLYQLRTPTHRLNFSVPGCCCIPEPKPVEHWIDLRDEAPSRTVIAPDIPEKVDRSFEPHSEIAVLADLNIPADELIRQCSPYLVSGKSMEIYASDSSWENGPYSIPLFLIRHQNEDHAHRYIPPPPGPLAVKASQWWNTLKNTVNSWF
jgi:hypothetical protein